MRRRRLDSILRLQAAAVAGDIDSENLGHARDDLFGEGKSVGEILEVAGRRHHDRVRPARIDERHRHLLGYWSDRTDHSFIRELHEGPRVHRLPVPESGDGAETAAFSHDHRCPVRSRFGAVRIASRSAL